MYIILIISLLVLLIVNGFVYKKDYLAPSSLYCLVLIVAALYGLLWYDVWELDTFGVKTYIVIMIGALVFSVTSWFIQILFRRRTGGNTYIQNGEINIGKTKWGIMFLLELLTFYFAYQFYGGSISQLSDAIISYRVASVRGLISMPTYLSIMLNICMVNGYLSGYFFVNNYLLCKKVSFRWLVLFVMSILISLLGGSRGGAVSIIIVTFAIFYILFLRIYKVTDETRRKRKIKILIVLTIILGIAFFIKSSDWIGRTMQYSGAYYFAIYLSAPLKNLDINIRNIDNGMYTTGFTSVNGLSLGNVGTVYTYEYASGGILMVIGTSLLVGVISAMLYEIIRSKNVYSNKCDLGIIIYAYVFYSISMIVFGSTLLDSIFSLFFIKVVACILVLLIYYNTSVSIRNTKITYRRIF